MAGCPSGESAGSKVYHIVYAHIPFFTIKHAYLIDASALHKLGITLI